MIMAALIMVTVFASFMIGEDRIIKLFGLGLATAVLIDAVIIRSVLVPALMKILGDWNWFLPERVRRAFRISPATSTLRYTSSSSIVAYQRATLRSQRAALRTSEMMFVSIR